MIVKEAALGVIIGVVAYLLFEGYNVLPILFIGGLLLVLYQATNLRMGQKSVATEVKPGVKGGISFDDIGGQKTAKQELIEALDFVLDAERVIRLGIRPLKGILLAGPPGTGKTLLARAAAAYTGSAFLSTSGSEFIEMYAGVGAQRVRELFRKARERARREHRRGAIIFIDELEVLGGKRGQHTSHLEYDQTLNQLLVEMDGLKADDEVRILIIGASNRVDLMDDALLRPGRFDRVVRVDLPDRDDRRQILEIHTRNKPLHDDVDLDSIARQCFGFSGAHLESLANEAAILAMRQGCEKLSQSHFLDAVDKVIMGEKLDRRPSDAELNRIALHEAGHALIGELEEPGYVAYINIASRGKALGYVRQSPKEDSYIRTKEDLQRDIRILVAGAVAEESILGSKSTGAAGDYNQALRAAGEMVFSGMTDAGIVSEEIVPRSTLHRLVSRILREEERYVKQLVTRYLRFLQETARELVEVESLSGDEFRLRLSSHK